MRRKVILIGLALGLAILPVDARAAEPATTPYLKTELYFGPVDRDEWDAFLAKIVTPRFPQGLTWFDVNGQWRDSHGSVRKLDSRLLILIYPRTTSANQGIEQIRAAFKQMFHQQSVLRVTEKVDASF